MDVSMLIDVLSNIGTKEATILANNGVLEVCSETENFNTYAKINSYSDLTLPKIRVDTKQLLEAVKIAEGADYVLIYADSRLTLKTSNMSFGIDVDESEHVTIPTIPGDECFETINFEGLKTAFSKTIGAAAKDKARPQLGMIYIDDYKVIATDYAVMAVYEMVQAPNILKDAKFALNSNFVKQILKTGKREQTASIYLDEVSFCIKLGEIIFICRRGEPFKFDYNRVLDNALQADHNALMVTGDLKKALKSLKSTLKQVENRLNFSFNENKATLRAGDFNLEIESAYESEPRRVTLNSEYVETFLKTAGAVTNIAVKNENAPVVLTTPDDNSYNFVIMPMRV